MDIGFSIYTIIPATEIRKNDNDFKYSFNGTNVSSTNHFLYAILEYYDLTKEYAQKLRNLILEETSNHLVFTLQVMLDEPNDKIRNYLTESFIDMKNIKYSSIFSDSSNMIEYYNDEYQPYINEVSEHSGYGLLYGKDIPDSYLSRKEVADLVNYKHIELKINDKRLDQLSQKVLEEIRNGEITAENHEYLLGALIPLSIVDDGIHKRLTNIRALEILIYMSPAVVKEYIKKVSLDVFEDKLKESLEFTLKYMDDVKDSLFETTHRDSGNQTLDIELLMELMNYNYKLIKELDKNNIEFGKKVDDINLFIQEGLSALLLALNN